MLMLRLSCYSRLPGKKEVEMKSKHLFWHYNHLCVTYGIMEVILKCKQVSMELVITFLSPFIM